MNCYPDVIVQTVSIDKDLVTILALRGLLIDDMGHLGVFPFGNDCIKGLVT